MARYPTLGAPLLASALAVLLLAAPTRAADVDKLLPNDTEIVFSINVRQILDAPLVKKLPLDQAKEALKAQDDAHQVLQDLGFDPFTDLDSITTAASSGGDTDKGLLIVRGKFDVQKFQAKAEAVAKDMPDTLKIQKKPNGAGGNTVVYEVNNVVPGQQTFYVALLNKTTLVASPGIDYVLDAADKEAGRKKTALKNKELQALLGRVDTTQSIWAVVLGSTLEQSPLGKDDDAKDIIAKVQDVIAGISIDKDFVATLNVTAKKTEDAKKIEDALEDGLDKARGALAFLASSQKEVKPLLNVLRNIKPSVKDKTVTVEIKLAGEMIEKAINKTD
ncbi:MAG TPA: hypothetical protein VG013_16605 [Gemmataceae bacterium]|jgi:hypothetical protein|nr:hypothetical protein [Gemmataceae bacterium]